MAARQVSTALIVRGITDDRDYTTQLASLVSELELDEVSAKEIFNTIDQNALQQEMAYFKKVSEIIRYEGFDPKMIIKILLRSWNSMRDIINRNPLDKETIDYPVIVDGQESQFTYTNNEGFCRDMSFICLVFITRGAAFEKMLKKSSDAMKATMNILKAKYNINTLKRRPGVTLDSNIVTIPRIAASFPGITVGLFHKGMGRLLVDPTIMYPGSNIPRALFSPMVTSLLPQTPQAPLAVMLAISTLTDDLLHQVDDKTGLQPLFQYMMASYNSIFITEVVKRRYCSEWGIGTIVNESFNYSNIILGLRERSKELIRQSRPNDVNLNNILSKV